MTPILYEFLEQGHLGHVNIGIHIDDILNTFGVPDGFSAVEAYYAALPGMKQHAYRVSPDAAWFRAKYGLLDILCTAENERVVFFKVYFRADHARMIPDVLNDGWLPLVDGITRSQFRTLIKDAKLQSKEVSMGRWADMVGEVWIPSSDLTVTFDLEDQNDRLLVLSRSSSDIGGSPCESRNCIDFT